MCGCTRRSLIVTAVAVCIPARANASPREFVAAAIRMRDRAVAAGDQSYGAVVVHANEIVGHGPSRVRELGEWTGHAERVAIADAQKHLTREDLSGCVMYSTSRPCSQCQRAAAKARIARMFYGPDATDAGAP